MEIDRRAFIASLGGTAAVSLMDSEAKADSLEHWMEERLDEQVAADQARRVPDRRRDRSADRNAQLSTRRGQPLRVRARQRQEARADAEESVAPGSLPPPFRARQSRVPERDPRLKTGMSEEVILACCSMTAC